MIGVVSGLALRAATSSDLGALADAHVRLLPLGLFPALGPRFMRRWQQTYLDSPHAVAVVVEDPRAEDPSAADPSAPGRGIVGFLLGTTDQAAYTRALLADRRSVAALVCAGGLALLGRPRLAVHFARTRARSWWRHFRAVRGGSAVPAARPAQGQPQVAVLSAVAVDPRLRGRGVGVRLVSHFLHQSQLGGAGTAELVTSTEPEGAAVFYERLGWSAVGDYRTPDGNALASTGTPWALGQNRGPKRSERADILPTAQQSHGGHRAARRGAGVLQLANGAARERQPDRRRIIAPLLRTFAPLLRTFAFTFPFRAAASPNRGTILPILDIRSGTHASCRGGPAAVTGDVDLAARAR